MYETIGIVSIKKIEKLRETIDKCEKITYNNQEEGMTMLIRFSVENFKSFRDQTEFYMTAGKATRHSNHLVEIKGKRLLKGAFIFGANASGKSNIIEAVEFAHDIVILGLDKVDCDRKYFRVDEQYKTLPGIFQFDFLSNNRFYSYGFAISYDSATVEEEWLYETGHKETCIFLRQKANDCQSYLMESELSESTTDERFRVYMSDFRSTKLSQSLFMSDVASRVPDNDSTFRAFRDSSKWFSKLFVIFPTSEFGNVPRLVNSEDIDLKSLLDYFDTGIEDVSMQNIDSEKLFASLPENISKKLRKDLFSCLKNDGDWMNMNILDNRLEVQRVEGSLSVSRVATDHGNPNDLFSFSDESDGTKRLFDLIPIYYACRQGNVVLVDEIDRSFHTKLTLEFIEHYYQTTGKTPCQLIATTQDSNLMDLDILRQDEIWFVERKADHSSAIFSLNRFRTRFDKKVEKDYLLGRYGGVPVFGQALQIEPDAGEEGGAE